MSNNEALLSVSLAASVAAIEAEFPGWEVWWVPLYTGAYVWCARRRNDPKWVLNASTADLLRRYIASAGNPG